MSSTQQSARTIQEGGAADLESYLWRDKGVEPTDPANATYQAYREPGAGFDNNINFKVTKDAGILNYEIGAAQDRIDSLDSRLEALRDDLTALENQFGAHDHDGRYYTQTEADSRFVNESGDTMSGTLTLGEDPTDRPRLVLDGDVSELQQTVQDGNGRASWYWNVESGSQEIITENEGASWFRMRGGDLMMSVYEGEPNDSGNVPNWERVLEAKFNFLDMPSGARIGDKLEMSHNGIEEIGYATFDNVRNDFITVSDGTGGSNNNPHTLRFNDRGLRFFSDQASTIMDMDRGGDIFIPGGDLHIDKSSARLDLGGENNGGPHQLRFGNSGDGDGLQLTYHTTPDRLELETWSGDVIMGADLDTRAVSFHESPYVRLPVRGGAPNNPPSGATWIET